jgi:hypothetical protein
MEESENNALRRSLLDIDPAVLAEDELCITLRTRDIRWNTSLKQSVMKQSNNVSNTDKARERTSVRSIKYSAQRKVRCFKKDTKVCVYVRSCTR